MTLKHQTITPLPNNKPDAVPELWNSRYRETDENFQGLDGQIETAKATIADHGERIGDIENQSASSVAQALRLDWLYRDLQIKLELFYPSWTLLDQMSNVVTDAVAGDDSMDLDSVAGIVPGKEYVVFDGSNQESVIITEILSAARVRIASNMGHSYKNALLRRTSWTVTDGKAVAIDGGIYLAGPVNMGDENADKTVVIRRDGNDALVALYFKDVNHAAWTRVHWSWKREITPGIKDLEYCIPARGAFDIKIVSNRGESGGDPAICHIACVDNATGLRGIHNPPLTPSFVYPLSGAIDVDEQPSLTTTAYSHPCGTGLRSSEFQISSNPDFADEHIIDQSGVVDGVSYSPAKDILTVNSAYYARARHFDNLGGISVWSAAVSFTTKSTFVTVKKPTCVSPAAGDELGTPDGFTMVSSAFGTDGGSDTHANSQWQIAIDPGFASIIYDSDATATDLTSHNGPAGIVERANTYYWRVRHQGTAEGWSDWSVSTVFNVSVMPEVDELFSTTLYTGNDSTQTITNGIDLADDGGMVWLKARNSANEHVIYDTARGPLNVIEPNDTGTEIQGNTSSYYGLYSFNNDGFSLGSWGGVNGDNSRNYVSHTFRNASKFFQAIKFIGNGVAGREIPHDLGCVPGMVIIKRFDATESWMVYHRGLTPQSYLVLNGTAAEGNGSTGAFPNAPTEAGFFIGADNLVNANGGQYVAYVFAHDPADTGLIQCGSYVGNYSSTGPIVNIGFEPQYLLIKAATTFGGWKMLDTERGIVSAGYASDDKVLYANEANAEVTESVLDLTSTGFQIRNNNADINDMGQTYIYMAIRKP